MPTSINPHFKLMNHTPLEKNTGPHSIFFIPSPSTLPRASKCTLHKSQLIIRVTTK